MEYIKDVFTSRDMSLRVGFDLIAYISEFLLPFWLVAEITIQAFHFVKGDENCILSSEMGRHEFREGRGVHVGAQEPIQGFLAS